VLDERKRDFNKDENMMRFPARFICVLAASLASRSALEVHAQDASPPPAPPVGAPETNADGAAAAAGAPNGAPPPAKDVAELAKATQNPVADLVALPFQFNFNTGGGLGDQTLFNLNFQPVIPIHLGSKVNLIARSIVPIFSAPAAGGERERGLGDIQEQLFFAPSRAGALVWGLGPIFSFPTATAASFVTGSWGLGPTGVFVLNAGAFVVGGLISQVSNIKDNEGRPRTNLFTLQPFFNYNFGAGWAVGLAPIITASWDAPRDDTWTLPLGASISRTLVFDKQPMTLSFQYYRNVVRPDAGPANQLRVVVNFLFPGG
jgi:hypothetical protein